MGHVTYSTTPVPDAVQLEKMDVSDTEDVDSSATHDLVIEEIRATAAQLEVDRKRREQARESERAKQQEEEDSEQVTLPPQPIIQYYPVYPLRFRYPHRQHPHRYPPRHHRLPHSPLPERQPGSDHKR